MKCPSCSEVVPALAERCTSCGAIVAPVVEGALAPKPRTVTPPPRDKVEPLRDIPGMPKKERTWRDEVQERVRRRKKKRAQASLPLFDQPEVAEAGEAPKEELSPTSDTQPAREKSAPAPEPRQVAHEGSPSSAPVSPELVPLTRSADVEGPLPTAERDFESARLSDEELADLPLRSAESEAPVVDHAAEERAAAPVIVQLPSEAPQLEDDLVAANEDDEEVSLEPPLGEPAPLERPARVGERAQAALVDAAILAVMGALVLYFAGRAARVDVASLMVSWPWVATYLALLGIFYAGYFTGTTGQTPGKMITGLRVVDARGRPPGYLRASLRAMAGALGTALAGLGLIPMALDPARRAVHDRLLHTRVIHR